MRMKHKLSQYLKLFVLGTTLFVFNCQQEDDIEKQLTNSVTQKSITKTVSAEDVPEIISFIQSKSNPEMQFRLDDINSPDGQNRNHEENLTLTTTLTNQIEQATNSFGKSNYTFELIEETTRHGVYFLNLIVKEYKDTFYMYIVKYVPDGIWLETHNIYKDFWDYTGAMYFYNDEGLYIANLEMESGTSISFSRHPCPEDG